MLKPPEFKCSFVWLAGWPKHIFIELYYIARRTFWHLNDSHIIMHHIRTQCMCVWEQNRTCSDQFFIQRRTRSRTHAFIIVGTHHHNFYRNVSFVIARQTDHSFEAQSFEHFFPELYSHFILLFVELSTENACEYHNNINEYLRAHKIKKKQKHMRHEDEKSPHSCE